ncbi:MAG: MFS transporter [Thermoplasmata archaeon]
MGKGTTSSLTLGRSTALTFTSAAHFLNDGGLYTIPLLAAILISEHLVPAITVTEMLVTFYFTSLVLSMYVAMLADRAKRPGLMVGLGLGLLAAGLLSFAASMTYARGFTLTVSVILSGFVAGLGTAFYHPIGAAILQTLYTDKTKGKALGINGGMGSLGRALYPSLFFVIASVVTQNGAIAFLAVIGVVGSFVVSVGLGKGRRTSSASSDPPDPAPGSTRWGDRITKPLVTLTLIAFVSALSTQGVAAWIPTYLAQQKGLGISTSLGFALSGMYAASILGQPLFGFLVDRFEKRLILAISIVGSALSIFGYLFVSGAWNTVLLALIGLFTFSGFPLFLSLASDYVPRRASSLSNALVWSLGVNGGGVVGPALVGIVVVSGYAGYTTAFEVMAVLALVSAVMILLLRSPPKSSKTAAFG